MKNKISQISSAIHDDKSNMNLLSILNLFSKWGLVDDDASKILGIEKTLYRDWKTQSSSKMIKMSDDTKTRIDYLLAIQKSLEVLFTHSIRRHVWMRDRHSCFHHRSPLSILKDGHIKDLQKVKDYLEMKNSNHSHPSLETGIEI